MAAPLPPEHPLGRMGRLAAVQGLRPRQTGFESVAMVERLSPDPTRNRGGLCSGDMWDLRANKAAAPNRRPRFAFAMFSGIEYLFCAPPRLSAVVGEPQR